MKKKRNNIFLFFSSILFMLLFAFGLSIKVNADIEYNEYNYLINVYDNNYDSNGSRLILFNVIARIQDNNYIYIDGDNTGYAFYTDYNINELGLVLVNSSSLEPVLNYYYYFVIFQATDYLNYIASFDAYGYNVGYNSGYDTGYNTGYDNGYDNGYIDGENSQSSVNYSDGYSNGWDVGYDTGYSAGLNAQIPQQQFSLFNLLGVIFLFPFKLLALGFDVDIFGVNVGGLMIGIIIISFISGLIVIAKSKLF